MVNERQDRNGVRTPLDVERRHKMGLIEPTAKEVEELKKDLTIDTALSVTSTNPVQNKAIALAVSSLNDNKVEKETGKGLSTNDYTTTEKNKLAGISSGAEANVIDTIKVNNITQTITNKTVNITVPEYTSDLINDSNFIDIRIVTTLPTQDISTKTIYLLYKTGSSGDLYDEYVYVNNTWELIGGSSGGGGDLSNYYTKSETDTLLNGKVDTISGKGLSTEDYTTSDMNKLSGIESGAEVNDIDTIKVNGTTQTISSKAVDITVPTKVSDLTNDSGFIDNTVNDLINYTLSSNLSTVATSGSYNDLSNKPTISEPTVIYVGKINQYNTSAKALDITNYPANTRIVLKHNDSSRYMYIKFKTYTKQIQLTDEDITVLNNIYYLDVNSISSSACSLAFTWCQTYSYGQVISIYKGVSYSGGWTVNDNQNNLLIYPLMHIKETSNGTVDTAYLQKLVPAVKQTIAKSNNVQRIDVDYIDKDGNSCLLNLISNSSNTLTYEGICINKISDSNGYNKIFKINLAVSYSGTSYSSNTLTKTDLGIVFNPSSITGYSATSTQILKNVNGTLTWINE